MRRCPSRSARRPACHSTRTWTLDIDQVAAAIRPNTKLRTINFPHNPTGAILDRDRNTALIELCRHHGIHILHDEIFHGLGPTGAEHLPLRADEYELGLSLGVMSKSYGLPGLRVGWIASQDHHLLGRMERLKHYLSICSSGPSERLAIIGLQHRAELLARNNSIIDENLPRWDAFFDGFPDLFEWHRPQGSCMAFPRYLGSDGVDEFARRFVEESGVLVLPSTIHSSDLGPTPNDRFRIAASAGEIELPPVGHITFPTVDGDCHIKFGHHRGEPDFVIKVATGFPQHARFGDPTGNGVLLVLSAETGQVRAVLHDEMVLTDVRTGIGGAIASRLLARPDAVPLLVVGTGVQARRQIRAHIALIDRPLDIAVWGRTPGAAAQLIHDVGLTDRATRRRISAQHVATQTSSSRPPQRRHRSSTQTGSSQELTSPQSAQTLRQARTRRTTPPARRRPAADNREQCCDHGELSALGTARSQRRNVVEIGELLGGHPGRRSASDITIADLTGIAAQDIAAANCVLHTLQPVSRSAPRSPHRPSTSRNRRWITGTWSNLAM